MKIFWSWQADRNRAVCKEFVRCALDAVARRLSEEQAIEEAERPIEVDQDTQGRTGMVDIAATILEKIDQSDVFVADLTSLDSTETGRQTANPNVLIELGYAMKTLPHSRILMVANTAWGFSHRRLPFDIAHRRGPITFQLRRDSDDEERQRTAVQLEQALADALRPIFDEVRSERGSVAVFEPTASSTDPARWWQPDQVLFRESEDWLHEVGYDLDIRGPSEPLLYFRLKPTFALDPIDEPDLLGHASELPLLVSSGTGGRSPAHNAFGGISYAVNRMDGRFDLLGATQVFRNREIWSFDCISTRTHPRDHDFCKGEPFLAHAFVEQEVRRSIPEFIRIADTRLHIPVPMELELGLAPSIDFRMTTGHGGRRGLSGRCQLPAIVGRVELRSLEAEEVENAVCNLIIQLWSGFGVRRTF